MKSVVFLQNSRGKSVVKLVLAFFAKESNKTVPPEHFLSDTKCYFCSQNCFDLLWHKIDLAIEKMTKFQSRGRISRKHKYRTPAIITCDLYIFYPIFGDRFFVFKEVFFRKFYTYVWLEQFVIKSSLGWCVYYATFKSRWYSI